MRCDMLWPRERLALEYDSDMFHSDESRQNRDADRRIRLERLGLHVIPIRRAQVMNANKFDRLAMMLVERTGKRHDPCPDWPLRRYELRQWMFPWIK